MEVHDSLAAANDTPLYMTSLMNDPLPSLWRFASQRSVKMCGTPRPLWIETSSSVWHKQFFKSKILWATISVWETAKSRAAKKSITISYYTRCLNLEGKNSHLIVIDVEFDDNRNNKRIVNIYRSFNPIGESAKELKFYKII